MATGKMGDGDELSFAVYHEWRAKREAQQSLRETERQRRVASLARMHQPLDGHWATNAGVLASKLDASGSDLNYKMHVARLKQIYINHKSDFVIKMYEKTTGDLSLPQSAVNKLYGNHGLVNQAPWMKKWETKQESNWRDDFVLSESLKEPVAEGSPSAVKKSLRKHHAALSSSSPTLSEWANAVGTTSSRVGTSLQGTRPSSAQGNSAKSSSSSSSTWNGTTKRPTRRYRSRQQLSDQDLVLLGRFWFDDQQAHIFQKAVRFLCEFDHYDALRIVKDAMSDAEAADTLSGYGGTALASTSAPSSSSGQGGGGGGPRHNSGTDPGFGPGFGPGGAGTATGTGHGAGSGAGSGGSGPQTNGAGTGPSDTTDDRRQSAAHLRRQLRFADLEGVSAADAVMLGLYHLTDPQAAVYRAFVDLLGGLDGFDRRRVAREVVVAAHEGSPLGSYCGTSFRPLTS